MSKKAQLGAAQVITALRNGPFREPAHAWLYEVRNATGYSKRARYADAIVVSTWPSRGLWIAGIEVKVSRSDWLKELDQPEKAAEIQRFCDYWWVAAPPRVVEVSELPAGWGLLEPHGKRVMRVVDAPRLEPEPLSREFLASVLRNVSESQCRVIQDAESRGYARAAEQYDGETVESVKRELKTREREFERAKLSEKYANERSARLRERIAEFQQATGIDIETTYWRHMPPAAVVKLAYRIAEMDWEGLRARFASLADETAALNKLKGAAE